MDFRHQKILHYLSRYGTHVEMDITPVLRELYPGVNRMDYKRVIQESKSINRLLSDMQQRDLIRYKKPAIGTGDKQSGLAWIDITPVYASLTEKGKTMLGQPLPQRATNIRPTQPQSQYQYQPQSQPQYPPHKPRTNSSNNSPVKAILTAISFTLLIGSAIEMCNEDAQRQTVIPVRTNSSPEEVKRIRAEFDKIRNTIKRNRLDSAKKDRSK